MNDGRGRHVKLGDKVQIWPGRTGRIVCSFEDQGFSGGYNREEWGHLTKGALVELGDGSLFHYEEPDEDFLVIDPLQT